MMGVHSRLWKAPIVLASLAVLTLPAIAEYCTSEPQTEACFHMLKLKPGILGVPPREFIDHPVKAAIEAVTEFWEIFGPGGKLHPAYFLAHKGHLVIEGLLVSVIAYLFLQHTFKPRSRSEEPLTEKEVDQLCKEWKPEPLTPTLRDEDKVPARIISSYQGKHVVADGKLALDVATFNFLGLSGTDAQKVVARDTIAKYGVGSCGPRGFYGTIDVHLKLEDDLCKFMGSPQAIVYSSDTATITSIIPAFANRKDVLVLDECCAYPVQQGATVSRATVYWFKHNDMADLERILKHVEKQAAKEKKPLNRRLIVVEGIYANTGELAPLDQLVRLKDQYKYRLVVEESFSFGVLGATGRGAVEHWGLAPDQVEIVCASMGNALGSVGGFCVGSEETVEHQRLSGSGYCFSASLPPYLATAASESVAQLQRQAGVLLPKLHANTAALRAELRKLSAYQLVGSSKVNDVSPLVHLHLTNQPADRHKATQLLAKITDHVLQVAGVLVGLALYSDLDRIHPPPALQLTVNAALTPADIQAIVAALSKAAREVL